MPQASIHVLVMTSSTHVLPETSRLVLFFTSEVYLAFARLAPGMLPRYLEFVLIAACNNHIVDLGACQTFLLPKGLAREGVLAYLKNHPA